MNFEDRQAPTPVGAIHSHAAVKTTGAQQCLVKSIGSVRRGNDYYRLSSIKTIHLDEQLVQCLFALIIGVDAGAALSTNGVNLVNEDDARRGFLGLIEQIAHTAGTNADQYLDKFRATHG